MTTEIKCFQGDSDICAKTKCTACNMWPISPAGKQVSPALNGLLGCPFCGEQPEVSMDGTEIEIGCCFNFVRQKSNYLTFDERGTWSNLTHNFNRAAEQKCLLAITAEWNTRAT